MELMAHVNCFNKLLLFWMIVCLLRGDCFVKAVSQQVLVNTLYDDLMTDYDSSLIPLCTSESTVTMNIDIALRQIMDMDVKEQILTSNIWFRMRWNDCRLTWDPASYNNLTYFMVTYGDVWIPDISLYDSAADGDIFPGIKNYRAYVSYTGSVTYNFPTVTQSICQVNVKYFPFDTQECPLQFRSWSHHGFELGIVNRNPTGDIDSFIEDAEWIVNDLPVTRNVAYYNCCPEPFPDVTYFVIMKRRPTFYLLTMIFPSILTSMISAFGFILPVESGEKVSLQITVLLSLSVFLLLVSESLPPSSDNFPLIATYFASSMVLVSVSLLQTVIVLNVFYRGNNGRTVPRWTRRIFFRFIRRLLCVYSKNEHRVTPVEKLPSTISDDFRDYNDKVEVASSKKYDENNNNNTNKLMKSGTRIKRTNNFFVSDTASVQMNIRSNSVKEMQVPDNSKWRDLANVLDRVFLILYVLVTLITTLTFMLKCF